MTVVLNGPSGTFEVHAEMVNVVDPRTNKPYPLITYQERFYEYAGTQDGAHFYRERA